MDKDLYKVAKIMTREEFMQQTANEKLCPSDFGLNDDNCSKFNECDDCMKNMTQNIKFKDEENEIIEETKANKIWTFNLEEFKQENIFIHCETNEEAIKLLIFFKDIKLKWYSNSEINVNKDAWEDCPLYSYTKLDDVDCGISRGSLDEFNNGDYGNNLTLYKFSEVNLLQVPETWDKESIDKVVLNNFDITKIKTILLDELLSKRGFKTGDILADDEKHVGIVLNDRIAYINVNCQDKLNPKAYCEFIPVESINKSSDLAYAVSKYFDDKEYFLLERYFIQLLDESRQRTIISVEFVVGADKPKDFLLELETDETRIGDIVECCVSNDVKYSYARVVNVNKKAISNRELQKFKTCRKLSIF